jgi:hypothetical protein
MTAETYLVAIFVALVGVSAACVACAFYQHKRRESQRPAAAPRPGMGRPLSRPLP